MKTLFDQLSEENKQKVIKNPYSTDTEDVLRNTSYVTRIMLTDVVQIFWTIYPNESFDLIKYYTLFDD